MGKKKDAAETLAHLQIGLVDAQMHTIKTGRKICIVLEGRDAAGKDGSIKRITEVLSARNTRVVALPKPTDREHGQWWFQRYVSQLPTAGEWVIFNRSWYNRAGVERVMGFSTPQEQEAFLRDVPEFERLLVRAGITLIKLWLDISREEQKERLDARRTDPRKRLKVSDLDAVAQAKWDDYTAARDDMLRRTHTVEAPWNCVHTDKKPKARQGIIRHILTSVGCPESSIEITGPDDKVVFPYDRVISGERTLEP